MSLPHSFRIGRAGTGGGSVVESLGSVGSTHPSGGIVINGGYGLAFYRTFGTQHNGGQDTYSFSLSGDTKMTTKMIGGGGGGGSYSDNISYNCRDNTPIASYQGCDPTPGGTSCVTIAGQLFARARGGCGGASRGAEPSSQRMIQAPAATGPRAFGGSTTRGGRGGMPGDPMSPQSGEPGAAGGGGGGSNSAGFAQPGGSGIVSYPVTPSTYDVIGATGGQGIDGNQYATSVVTPGFNPNVNPTAGICRRGGGGGAGHRSEGGGGAAGLCAISNPASPNYTALETVQVYVGRGGRGFLNNQGGVRPQSAPTADSNYDNGVGGHGVVVIEWPAP